jgi:hypothetical protein
MARQRQCHHQAKWNDKGTMATGDKGGNNEEEAKQTKKKVQEMLFDVSWAVGKYFLLLFYYFAANSLF